MLSILCLPIQFGCLPILVLVGHLTNDFHSLLGWYGIEQRSLWWRIGQETVPSPDDGAACNILLHSFSQGHGEMKTCGEPI